MTAQVLRPHQVDVIKKILEHIRAKKRRVLVSMPTGAGKTTTFSEIARSGVLKGHRVAIGVHRKELMEQARARVRGQGLPCGLIGDNRVEEPEAPVQIISIPTLASWQRRGKSPPGDFKIAVLDECHHGDSATWVAFRDWARDAWQLGFSATPWGAGGVALTGWDALVEGPAAHELVGTDLPLCPVVCFGGPVPDLEGVKHNKADFIGSQLSRAYLGLEGDFISEWWKRARDRKTICFATSIPHSMALVKEWQRIGVNAAHLDFETSKADRREILDRFRAGVVQVLSNVALFTEGVDVPDVDCVVLARATRSESLYCQMVGRGLRAAAGKEHCLVIDHGRNVERFGHPLARRFVPFGEGAVRDLTVKTEEDIALGAGSDDGMRMCVACLAIAKATSTCPNCGQPMAPPRLPKVKKMSLVELKIAELTGEAVEVNRLQLKRDFWQQMRSSCLRKGQRLWKAVHTYKATYGRPPWEDGILSPDEHRQLWQLLNAGRVKR